MFAVTHPDKHVREGSSGVFRHIDRRDDPVSLLSPQPIGGGAPLMLELTELPHARALEADSNRFQGLSGKP